VTDRITRCDIWACRSFFKLNDAGKIVPSDAAVFNSLMNYHKQFDDLTSKHISLIRARLLKNPSYINYIVRTCNDQ
jgi:hypothetical protein